ncbi:MAG: radical SAM protein [Deltaproteobacteria bacterium]|nr:radical SAM protein [Deltaproteobacteria bacterium]
MILVNPPVVKPCEAPAGIAKLAGALQRHNIPCRVLDANLEGLLSLLKRVPAQHDTWTKVASRRLPDNLKLLTSQEGYENFDRYKRAVMGVNRMLENAARSKGIRLSLANYSDQKLSPLRSADLIRAWKNPEENLFYPYFEERLLSLLEKNETNGVGLSLNYLSQALCTFAMAGFLKKQSANLKVILGGGLVTSWMSRPDWKNPFEGLVDLMVSGPGEKALLSFAGVSGIDDHVVPDYGDFPSEDYFAPGVILPYSASSGCYWGECSFCPENAEGNTFRPVRVQEVARDVRALFESRKPVLIHFLDNAMSPALLKTLSEQPPGAPWYGFARVTKDLKDPDFCEALKRSGCRMLKLGLESGDQAVLDNLCKGIDLEIASLALKALNKAGIATYVYLLFGTPAETADGAHRTLDFTVRHSESIDFLNIAIFNMPAHGADADKFETKDFYEGDLSLYKSFAHPGGWDRSAVRRFLDREFKRHPAIAPILRRDPPLFTSNHAPFFCT